MLPLFFCIFEILLQMAGIVTICKSHGPVKIYAQIYLQAPAE